SILVPPSMRSVVGARPSAVARGWQPSGSVPSRTEYVVWRDGHMIAEPRNTTFIDSRLQSGTIYHYAVETRGTLYPAAAGPRASIDARTDAVESPGGTVALPDGQAISF